MAAPVTPTIYLPSPITITPYMTAIKLDHPGDYARVTTDIPYTSTKEPMTAIGYCFIPGYSFYNPMGITTNAIWLTSDGKWTPADQVTPAPPQLFDDATATDLSHYSEPNALQNSAPKPTVVNQAPATNVLAPPTSQGAPITQQQIVNGMPLTPNMGMNYSNISPSQQGGVPQMQATAAPMPSWLIPAAAGVLLLMFMGKGN